MIQTAEQLCDFLRAAALGELARAPLPANREEIAYSIGMTVKAALNRLKAMDYLPLSFQFREITVDFDRVQPYPRFTVTVLS